jgi:RNA polymerase sigma factor (sigma-70 family)
VIRVLVVDDHAFVREGLRAFLDLQDGIEVVGEAADGEEAIAAADRLRPDVVLLDLVMPGRLDGVAAIRVLPALRAGAAGYLLKNSAPAEVARAVHAARAGEAVLDPSAAARLIEALARVEEPLDTLTPREREVLVLLGRGFPNKQIARELGLAEKTVKTHVGHVLAKLGVADRTQAAVVAVRAGLVAPGS